MPKRPIIETNMSSIRAKWEHGSTEAHPRTLSAALIGRKVWESSTLITQKGHVRLNKADLDKLEELAIIVLLQLYVAYIILYILSARVSNNYPDWEKHSGLEFEIQN